MRSTKARFLGLLVAVVVAVAIGVLPAYAVGTTRLAAADQTHSGHGISNFTITLDKGLTVFDCATTGSAHSYSNFIVWLMRASDDSTVGLVANWQGDGHESVALKVPADGDYRVEIRMCDADWSITARQPRATTAASTRTWTGDGVSVTELFYLPSGTYKFTGSQQGQWNFIVHLVDLNGDTTAFLANETGTEQAEKVFVVKKTGVYVLAVDADGPFNMSIAKHYIPFRLYGLSAPTSARARTWFTVSVKLDPGYIGVSSSPVTMYAQKKSGKKWINKIHVHLSGDYATHTKFSARLNVSKGTWRVWAQFDDAEHTMKKTGYRYVSVK